MKKFAWLWMAALCFTTLSLTGCGGSGETQVIEAPPVEEEDPAMAGMTEEEYNAEMEKSMQ
ncbi:hypothetical protein [Stieleria sp.]|jgi:hypothetical protein|uniref:Secreted protein n=1 Tax=Stieleria magnilauensis TaxID=2527963 RepID=A0ABX5XXB2_9BACT|nr:hypothetical protein [Phycisphaera sp. RhM]QDV86411.1 hypothetical protein TBK1r_54300 [Planctomycetes bacterium TBK1r]